MMNARALIRISTVAALAVAVAGCEPADLGGGAGIGEDGNLAFISSGRLASAAAEGTGFVYHTRQGTYAAEPALSPNGQAIAFAYSEANSSTSAGIVVVSRSAPVDTGFVFLTDENSTEGYSSPAWDPAGSTVYFVSGGSIFRAASAGGGAPEAVAASVTDARYVSVINSSTLLVTDTSGAISTVAISSGTATPLDVTTNSRPAVSADGTLLAYSNSSGVIVVRPLAGGEETELPSGQAADTNPSFAPNGDFVAFESGGSIYSTSVDGLGGRDSLFMGATSPSWSQ